MMQNQLLSVNDSAPRTNGENDDATTCNHSNDTTSHMATTTTAAVYQRRPHPLVNSDNRDHSNGNSNSASNHQVPTRYKSNTNTTRKEKVHSTENSINPIILLPKAQALLLNLAASLSSSTAANTNATNPTVDQHQQRQQQEFIRRTTVSIISLCMLYIYVLFRTQYILDKHEAYFHHHHQPNAKNQLRRGQPVRMIPISPLEMVQHPDAVQQLVQNLRQQQEGDNNHNNRILGDSVSREPRQYLQYLQNQALQTKQASQDSSTSSSPSTNATITNTDLFIIYNANIPGQGVGNLIAGLLAAHLLGDEFHRIVCVNPQFWNSGFLTVFEPIDPIAKAKCPLLLQQQDPARLNETRVQDLALINYAGAADECDLQNLMVNTNMKVIYMIANTYPRWPVVPNNYFLQYYQPTSMLFDALPYSIQPTTVVHLRQPDDDYDRRDGLDSDSLNALGKLLPSNSSTFLVTNNVDFYHRFHKCCQWSHPSWKTVTHTALGVSWGHVLDDRDLAAPTGRTNASEAETNELTSAPPPPHVQTWVDWYTILMADDVYHIHSDFSISAIHWMNKKNHAFTIQGYNEQSQQLATLADLVWEDGETIPVRDRTVKGQPGTTNDLRACSGGSRGVVEDRERCNNHK